VQRLSILGATGSIGLNTLDVVSRHPDRFEVVALSGHRQSERLAELCLRHRPRVAVVTGGDAQADALERRLRSAGCATEVWRGPQALEAVASLPEVGTVMAAIVGAAGLRSTLAAARTGKKVLLANKESLVMAGAVFMEEVRRNRAQLLPIDSEHNAVFQALPSHISSEIEGSGAVRIVLTASGGPFRQTHPDLLDTVTPEQACAHPNWVMGRKISVDSATMMNKGLEVIEAHWLFGARPEQIEVLIHPQSVIHSMVEYVDGSVIAQLGNPDMRTPIAHALAYPERIEAGVKRLDLAEVARLTFERPDPRRFPALDLAYAALRQGGTAPAVLNAANEVGVAAFLDGELPFTGIAPVIAQTLERVDQRRADSLETILAADGEARSVALEQVARRRRRAS
jgi:1-deoxy-D-xylulose-5-phosphate reductoisomerase